MSKIRKYSVENLDTSGKMTIFAPAKFEYEVFVPVYLKLMPPKWLSW